MIIKIADIAGFIQYIKEYDFENCSAWSKAQA